MIRELIVTGEQVLDALIDALHDQDFTGYQCEAIREEVATLMTMGAFDPYMPDWTHMPDWAQYHTIDADGTGMWWKGAAFVMAPKAYMWMNASDGNTFVVDTTSPYDMTGLDWRNSLRARPEVQS